MYISRKKSATRIQKATRISGRNWLPRIRPVSRIGIARRMRRAPSIPITPSSLLGILRSTV